MTAIVLDVRQVHARYGKREVLSGVSLQVPAGEWFCLLGPNGVGKSTLLRCISGALTPSEGDLLIDGHSAITDPLAAKQRLGYACAPEQLPGLLTGRQCLEVYAQAKGLSEISADVLALAHELRFDGYFDAFVDTYSLGTRQKLCILLALLGEPMLIVLDEAFNGLDPASALQVKHHLQHRLAERRCAVLLATHSLDIVEHYADKAALLIDGRIVREWSETEIAAFRVQGDSAMETALAHAADSTTSATGQSAAVR
jgi:ABC-2 type transport system ATP-binding protein